MIQTSWSKPAERICRLIGRLVSLVVMMSCVCPCRRCKYLCCIEEAEGRPLFRVKVVEKGYDDLVLTGPSPKGEHQLTNRKWQL